jgi:hypothetical protein
MLFYSLSLSCCALLRFASQIIFPKEKPEKRKQVIHAGKAENQKETE